MSRFKQAVQEGKEFVITCEHVPGRGLTGKRMDSILQFAEEAAGSESIHGLSLTDNAGGNPAFSADILGFNLLAMGVDPIIHFSTKDMNRNAIEARAYALKKCGLANLLVMTGDYPISGFMGIGAPVFDLDSVIAVHYLKKISEGLEIQEGKNTVKLPGTDFFLGAVVSSFKWTEASLVLQYYKLEKKIRAGADFIVSQLGYDSRKYVELIRYVRNYLGLDIPVLGSVYILSAGTARFMNSGEVPGCYVDDRLLKAIQQEAKGEDKGKAARLERAARELAMLKGLGYNGAHIEGLNLKFADVRTVLERSEEIGDNWPDHLEELNYSPQDHLYFLFEGGEEFKVPAQDELPAFKKTRRRPIVSFSFWLMRLFHKLIFIENKPGYRFMRGIIRFADKHKGFYRFFKFMEHAAKKVIFDCRKCDDCALFDTYYICPVSECPKGMRIGPCGGSRPDGHCEVFEDRECIWERIYWRARRVNELEELKEIGAPRNWALYETSSWINYYLKRDRSGVNVDIPEEIKR